MTKESRWMETAIAPTLPLDAKKVQHIYHLEQQLGSFSDGEHARRTLDVQKLDENLEPSDLDKQTAVDLDLSVVYLLHTLPQLSFEEDGVPNPDFSHLQKIAEGGIGELFTAYQTALSREVVVKRLKPSRIKPKYVRMLIQEAQVSGTLEHPNIVPIHLLGRDRQDQLVLVMKRVNGVCWKDLLEDPYHPFWQEINTKDRMLWNLEILIQVCNALQFAHSRGYIHRDIKPANIMIGRFQEVYLLDWGLALPLLPLHNPERNAQLPFAGTPAYMAPEMVWGRRSDMSERTDVYLLGACLHELITGRPPHAHESLSGSLFSAANAELQTLSSRIPTELSTLCLKAIQKEPSERFPDVASFRQELRVFLQHQSAMQTAQQLYEAAQQRWYTLREMKDGSTVDNAQIYRLFHECRFGYSQAIQQWPSHEEAAIQLEDCLRWMIEHEFKQMNLGAASALIRELRGDASTLQAKLRHLQKKAAGRIEESQLLRVLQEERSTTSVQPLLWLFAGLLLAGLLMIGGLHVFGKIMPGSFTWVATFFAMFTVFTSVAYWKREQYLASPMNRMVIFLCMGVLGGLLAIHMLGTILYREIFFVLIVDLVLLSIFFVSMGALFQRSILLSSVVCLCGSVLVTQWPTWALFFFYGAGIFSLSLMLLSLYVSSPASVISISQKTARG